VHRLTRQVRSVCPRLKRTVRLLASGVEHGSTSDFDGRKCAWIPTGGTLEYAAASRFRQRLAAEVSVERAQIPVSPLRRVAIQFEVDFYQLAVWLLKHNVHNTTPATTRRHTVHGVATAYEYLAHVPR